jgi:hypothetical protein
METPLVIRNVVLLLALALTHPALGQTTPAPSPTPSTNKLAKPAPTNPASPKPDAGANSADTAAAGKQGPCVGVIPHIGDRMEVQNIGLTVFNNDFNEVPIESWVSTTSSSRACGPPLGHVSRCAGSLTPTVSE